MATSLHQWIKINLIWILKAKIKATKSNMETMK